MFITIINDCRDDNASGRQIARAQSCFGITPNLIGVRSDLEAGGNLIDILDAVENRVGVILVNVAPRNGQAKKWENGTPFCFFYYQKTLVIAPASGHALSFVKKLKLIKNFNQINLEKTITKAVRKKIINASIGDRIKETQFRSFEFLPRLAYWMNQGFKPESRKITLTNIPDLGFKIWWVDNFGNCKTSVFSFEEKKHSLSHLPRYKQLRDVPDNELALITGSSGLGKKRFIEIVKQGGNALQELSASRLSKDLLV